MPITGKLRIHQRTPAEASRLRILSNVESARAIWPGNELGFGELEFMHHILWGILLEFARPGDERVSGRESRKLSFRF
jgi:hypothetical protein